MIFELAFVCPKHKMYPNVHDQMIKFDQFDQIAPVGPQIHGAGRSAVTSWSIQRRKVPASHGPGHKTFTEEKSSSAQTEEKSWS